VHGLEAEYWGRIDFVYLDVDDPANRNVMRQYGFTSQPLFVLIAPDGTEIQRWFGYINEEELRQAFDVYLSTTDS
jgi:thioredoxin-like negative regulator of GroEL